MANQFKAGDRVVRRADNLKGYVTQDQSLCGKSLLGADLIRVMFEGYSDPLVVNPSGLDFSATFTVIASKTWPHEDDYSPAYIDDAATLEEAMEKLARVRDYPYSMIEHRDSKGRRWDIDARELKE